MSGPDDRPVVLLVTPDAFDLYPLSTYLAEEGFRPQRAAPDHVIAAPDEVRPDLILLSELVDDPAGLDMCTQVTGRSAAPVVILASWDSDGVEQRLNHRADHYVVWPQRRREMVARLRAVVRRASGYRVEAFRVQPFQVDEMHLDSEGWIVSVGDQKVPLSPGERGATARP